VIHERILGLLRKQARAWGGDVSVVPRVVYGAIRSAESTAERFYEAPFTDGLGSFWSSKVIVISERNSDWAGIVHEMGHCFAAPKNPDDYNREYDFFGWEWALVRALELPETCWRQQNKNYVVGEENGDSNDFGVLSLREQTRILEARLGVAKKLGLVRGSRPIAIR